MMKLYSKIVNVGYLEIDIYLRDMNNQFREIVDDNVL